ncbi:sigma factor-like helix-turn-helix DNA-binding protein [Streptomyces montanisoli]|uniref:RNA polymerase sigma-70 factor n=1 Tax=Streptomyces montanisoli TaxID=2798581 RepID=A0A940RXQ7_9ACTN|nr:sigma factor-like helix-turn-helix DNA-binding protein [Streptomyces montanisoli]MBP0460581.1 RNA polymerase sigma-70 factor [Streptomyces montanisoli]
MAELAVFERERRRLAAIAHHVTGSVTDADDAVREVRSRWQRLPAEEAGAPRAYLTAAVARFCHDRLTEARARRDAYAGIWLPEPLVTDAAELDATAGTAGTAGTAALSVLERLTPAERTAYVLHDLHAVPFADIAGIVGRDADAVRRLASHARRRVRAEAPAPAADRQESARAVDAFRDAVMAQDSDALLEVLDPDVVLRSDGGGLDIAARWPVIGAEKVATSIARVLHHFGPRRLRMVARDVNGAPGAVLCEADAGVVAVYAFRVGDGRIRAMDGVLNPDKLRNVRAAELTPL